MICVPQASLLSPATHFLQRAGGVAGQGFVQTKGLQVLPLSQEARQACPLTGPPRSQFSAGPKPYQFNVARMYSVLNIALLCFFLISIKTRKLDCSFYIFLT